MTKIYDWYALCHKGVSYLYYLQNQISVFLLAGNFAQNKNKPTTFQKPTLTHNDEMSALKGVLCRENARNEIKHQTTQGRCFSYALGSSPSKTKSSRNKYDDAPPTMEQLRSIGDQTDSLVWSPSNDRLVQLQDLQGILVSYPLYFWKDEVMEPSTGIGSIVPDINN